MRKRMKIILAALTAAACLLSACGPEPGTDEAAGGLFAQEESGSEEKQTDRDDQEAGDSAGAKGTQPDQAGGGTAASQSLASYGNTSTEDSAYVESRKDLLVGDGSGNADSAVPAVKGAEGEPAEIAETAEEETAELVQLDSQALSGIEDYLNEMSSYGFLLSSYERPEDIDLRQVFYSGAKDIREEITEEEKELLLEQEKTDILYTSVTKVTEAYIDELLERKAGITYEESNFPLGTWVHLDEFGAYYHLHGDTNVEPIRCLDAWQRGDTLIVHYQRASRMYGSGTEKVSEAETASGDAEADEDAAASSPAAYYTPTYEAELKKNGDDYQFCSKVLWVQKDLIEAQSYLADLNPLGEVFFAPIYPDTDTDPRADVTFILVKDKALLRTLNEMEPGNIRTDRVFTGVEAVDFTDYNGDGYTDILTVCSYRLTNAGGSGSWNTEVREARVYTMQASEDGNEGWLVLDAEKTEAVNEDVQTLNITNITEYLTGRSDGQDKTYSSWKEAFADHLRGLKENGTFLYNSPWSVEETKKHLPDFVKKYLAEKHIKMYIIDATKIAAEIGLGNRTNTILQSAFFKISEVIPYDLAVEQMKKFIVKSYGKKGEDVVNKNYAAVDRGGEITKVDIPAEWADLPCGTEFVHEVHKDDPEFIAKVMRPMVAQCGNDLPVSAFKDIVDGTFPAGTTAYEKRGVATVVPEWISDNCIQCNQCSLICPHAAIRPTVMTDEELKNAPEGMKSIVMKAPKEFAGMHFRMQVSVMDCTGCGNCADVCPAKEKALVMKPFESQLDEADKWEYSQHKVTYKDNLIDKYASVKNSQFSQPLFEFSGACAGCGETPYIKCITQLFGESMMVANATGCSSIYGGSAPATPYCKNYRSGKGVAWANSLFEDNAEFGLGMATGYSKIRESLRHKAEELLNVTVFDWMKEATQKWLDTYNDTIANRKATDEFVAALEKAILPIDECIEFFASEKGKEIFGDKQAEMLQQAKDAKAAGRKICICHGCELESELLANKDFLAKRSQWIFGGDGWAYDIGFGGLDHVLASGEDVNVLVLDTEVYSNTGGQSSKATPAGAVAKFAASGKKVRKKDLGMIAKSYGYVYVAQVAMGASQAQYFKVIKEAEAYNGPSLIICYAPCINHGIKIGMGRTQHEEKLAVDCGYWHLWHFNPEEEDAGQNGFHLDSKEPDWSKFQEFIMGEVRYNSLLKTFPEEAKELFAKTEQFAKLRYEGYKKLSEGK